MNVVTSANHAFAHCLAGLVASVHEHYGRPPIVYDVGLTGDDRDSLDADVVPMPVGPEHFGYARDGGSRFIRATHKPACIRHYWRNHSERMIFVDADCLFAQRVEEAGFDVGVTLRPRDELDVADHYNGVLNAGVVMFNAPAGELIERWAEACGQAEATDQSALTAVLSETIDWPGSYGRICDWHGLKVKVFPTETHNDYRLGGGKILHFKGLRHESRVYARLLEARRRGEDMWSVFEGLRRGRKRRRSWLGRLLGRRRREGPAR
jgi:hypothetical protein